MPSVLRCMSDSPRWSELHLHVRPSMCESLMQPDRVGGLSEQLAALQLDDRTAQRIRVYVYRGRGQDQVMINISCFHISVDESTGQRVWLKE